MPFAYIMGVQWDDAFEVAELLGVKTFLNEFISYKRLAKLIENRVNDNGNYISVRIQFLCKVQSKNPKFCEVLHEIIRL